MCLEFSFSNQLKIYTTLKSCTGKDYVIYTCSVKPILVAFYFEDISYFESIYEKNITEFYTVNISKREKTKLVYFDIIFVKSRLDERFFSLHAVPL